MANEIKSSAFGIDYSNLPSPFYDSVNKNAFGEGNLTPYVAIHGGEIWSNSDNPPTENSSEKETALHRFVLNVSPLKDASYPQSVQDNALINLDSAQLGTFENYKFGLDTQISRPFACAPGWMTPGYGGVYDAPTPLRGGPVEFRRVYFRGIKVDSKKGHDLKEGPQSFAAYFPCSLPILQTEIQHDDSCDEPSGTLYNSRDLNYSYSSNAEVLSWDDLDISIGGDLTSCTTFSSFIDNSGNSTHGINSPTVYIEELDREAVKCGEKCESLLVTGVNGLNTRVYYTEGLPLPSSGTDASCAFEEFDEETQENVWRLRENLAHTGFVLEIDYTGCQSPYTGFSGNGLITGSTGSGCRDFTFSGISGIDTQISGDNLLISYTGCSLPFTGFEANSGDTYELSGSGCTGFIFSGRSGINTFISGNALVIEYTGSGLGSGSGCGLPYASFSGNGFITGSTESDCRDFTFSGTSGIDTQISGDNLLISYTGCSLPYTGFSGNGLIAGSTGSGCRIFTFSGVSGIDTQIFEDNLLISYTGALVISGENCKQNSEEYELDELKLGFHPDYFYIEDNGPPAGPIIHSKGVQVSAGTDPHAYVHKLSFPDFSGTFDVPQQDCGELINVVLEYTGCKSPFTGFLANSGATESDLGCTGFLISGVEHEFAPSGIRTEIVDNVLKISQIGCHSPFTGFNAFHQEIGAPGFFETDTNYANDWYECKGFTFSGSEGIRTEILYDYVESGELGYILQISDTGCKLPFTGFKANSGDTFDLSNSGCMDFTYSGGKDIDTIISGKHLIIDYTGCTGYSFGSVVPVMETGLILSGDPIKPDSCGDSLLIFGHSGILVSNNENVLEIAYTGCHSPYTGFSGNGLITGSTGSGCRDFTFSGISGIDTQISGDNLLISYTGCSLPFTGFEANTGDTYQLADSGCTGFMFSGRSGINTFISGNTLVIEYTGSGSGGCTGAFSSFSGQEGSYEASGCDQFIFSGASGIKTSITKNVLAITYEHKTISGSSCGLEYEISGVLGGKVSLDASGLGDCFNFSGGGCGLSVEHEGQNVSYNLDASGLGDCFNFSGSGCGLSVEHEGQNVSYNLDASGLGDCFNFSGSGCGLSVEHEGQNVSYNLDASGLGDCFNFSGSGCGLSVEHEGQNVSYNLDASGLGDCFNFSGSGCGLSVEHEGQNVTISIDPSGLSGCLDFSQSGITGVETDGCGLSGSVDNGIATISLDIEELSGCLDVQGGGISDVQAEGCGLTAAVEGGVATISLTKEGLLDCLGVEEQEIEVRLCNGDCQTIKAFVTTTTTTSIPTSTTSYNHDSSSYNHDSSSYNHDSSSYNHDSSSYNHDSSSYNHDSSSYNHDSSSYNHDSSANYYYSSSYNYNSSSYNHDSSSYNYNSSSYNHDSSSYNYNSSSYNYNSSSDYNDSSSDYNDSSSDYNDSSSDYNDSSSYNHDSSSYNHDSSANYYYSSSDYNDYDDYDLSPITNL